MLDLKMASEGIRKAAAIEYGVFSGKFELVTVQSSDVPIIIAKVYNRNYPDGAEISTCAVESALSFTWKEIRDFC